MEGLGFPTETSTAQWELELTARDIYARAVRRSSGGIGGGGGITEVIADAFGDGGDGMEEDEGGGGDGDGDGSGLGAPGGAWELSTAVLNRDAHIAYLHKSLRVLSAGHVVLDASRCWLCYWIVHSLALLGAPLPPDAAADVVEFLTLCHHPEGGFGAGPYSLHWSLPFSA